jgi:hypothetical protein
MKESINFSVCSYEAGVICHQIDQEIAARSKKVKGYVWVRYKDNPGVRYCTGSGKTSWSKVAHAKAAIRLDIEPRIRIAVKKLFSLDFPNLKSYEYWEEVDKQVEKVYDQFLSRLEFIEEI